MVHVVKYLLAAFTSWDDDVYYFVENKIKERKKKVHISINFTGI